MTRLDRFIAEHAPQFRSTMEAALACADGQVTVRPHRYDLELMSGDVVQFGDWHGVVPQVVVADADTSITPAPSFSHNDGCARYYMDEADAETACTCGATKAQAWLDALIAERQTAVPDSFYTGVIHAERVIERVLGFRPGSMASDAAAPVAAPTERPEIVVLCGSTRFKDAFREAAKSEALAGRIVLTVSDLDPRPEMRNVNVPIDPGTKAMLDRLHRHKIDLADRVLVLNVGGYIGESTRGEIDYAVAHGKPITYLESTAAQSATETLTYPGQMCSCGRPARTAFLTEGFGSVGYCGVPGRRPLNPHTCDLILTVHDAGYCAQLRAHTRTEGEEVSP